MSAAAARQWRRFTPAESAGRFLVYLGVVAAIVASLRSVEIIPEFASAREVCERLLGKGVLSKETHDTVVRLAPPLVIAREDLDGALDRFEEVLHELVLRPHPVAA